MSVVLRVSRWSSGLMVRDGASAPPSPETTLTVAIAPACEEGVGTCQNTAFGCGKRHPNARGPEGDKLAFAVRSLCKFLKFIPRGRDGGDAVNSASHQAQPGAITFPDAPPADWRSCRDRMPVEPGRRILHLHIRQHLDVGGVAGPRLVRRVAIGTINVAVALACCARANRRVARRVWSRRPIPRLVVTAAIPA